MDPLRRIEILDRRECMSLMAGVPVGRLAYCGHDGTTAEPSAPHVTPVSFVVDGESVVVRTTQGSRLGREVPGTPVTFEVDEVRTAHRDGWSVVVSGLARLETDPAATDRLAELLQAWAPGFKDVWLRIPIEHVSGRRVGRPDDVVQLPDRPRARWREHEGWTPPTRTPAEFVNDFDGC
jgi:uncharacterized protein